MDNCNDDEPCTHPPHLIRGHRTNGKGGAICGACKREIVPCPHPRHAWIRREPLGFPPGPWMCRLCGQEVFPPG